MPAGDRLQNNNNNNNNSGGSLPRAAAAGQWATAPGIHALRQPEQIRASHAPKSLVFQQATTSGRPARRGNPTDNMQRRGGGKGRMPQQGGPHDHHPYSGREGSGAEDEQPHVLKRELYKTEMCKSFEQNGTCRYAEKCQFAHGREQLRVTRRHPKYKSRRCRNFALHGSCDYGSRCMFLHEMGPSSSASVSPGPPVSGRGSANGSAGVNGVSQHPFQQQQQQQQQQSQHHHPVSQTLPRQPRQFQAQQQQQQHSPHLHLGGQHLQADQPHRQAWGMQGLAATQPAFRDELVGDGVQSGGSSHLAAQSQLFQQHPHSAGLGSSVDESVMGSLDYGTMHWWRDGHNDGASADSSHLLLLPQQPSAFVNLSSPGPSRQTSAPGVHAGLGLQHAQPQQSASMGSGHASHISHLAAPGGHLRSADEVEDDVLGMGTSIDVEEPLNGRLPGSGVGGAPAFEPDLTDEEKVPGTERVSAMDAIVGGGTWGRPSSGSFDQQLPDSTQSVIKDLLSSSPSGGILGDIAAAEEQRAAAGENEEPMMPWLLNRGPASASDLDM